MKKISYFVTGMFMAFMAVGLSPFLAIREIVSSLF
jgi:hypothetical protein